MEKKVDGAWKDRAEQEKKKAEEKARREAGTREPPSASFAMLLEAYAYQAEIGFGDVEDPKGGRIERDLSIAKFAIDMLGIIEEKTKGNLTSAEESVLRSLLQNLRLRYLDAIRGEEDSGGDEAPTE